MVRAIKVIPKKKVKNVERLKAEIDIMRSLVPIYITNKGPSKHNKIIWIFWRYRQGVSSYGVIYIINPKRMCEGGELFDRILEKGQFTEIEARSIFK